MNVADIKRECAASDAMIDAEDERQNGWGGKRKGAGRKPIDEGKRMIKRGQVYMTRAQAVWVDRQQCTNGFNFSTLVRSLIKKAMGDER